MKLQYWSCLYCFIAVGYVLKLPVVGIETTFLYPWMNEFIGNPLNLATAQNFLFPYYYGGTMKSTHFWDRVKNVITTYSQIYFYKKSQESQMDQIKKYLGPDIPELSVLGKYASLMLINSHYTLTGVIPKNPSVIEIAGIHIINDTKPIPSVK